MISIRKLCVDLGEFVLHETDLDIRAGEYFVILGPTGSGKTVLLESIAGLYPMKQGQIALRGKDVTRLEPEKRGISIVYQDHVLFPHLLVRDNILFGLRMQKTPAAERREALDWVVDLLGISHLLHRKPDTLSGGERQKVALARALITRPNLLLLDEPLSALDPASREVVQQELKELHKTLSITIVHVTHDFEEAIALGQRIAVIGEGELKQVGTPEDIFRHPNSEFVARFSLTRNIFAGTVVTDEQGNDLFAIGGTDTKLNTSSGLNGYTHASIRPDDIIISLEPIQSSARNCFAGRITGILDKYSTVYVTVDVPPEISCLVTKRSFEELELEQGKKVYITFKATSLHLF